MDVFLAYAAKSDSPTTIAEWLMITVFTALVFVALAVVPIALAVSRRPRHRSTVTLLALLWAMIATASVSYFSMRQMDWNTTIQQRIEDGDFDPTDTDGKPIVPIALWGGLGVAYAVGTIWVGVGKRTRVASPGYT